MSKDTTLQKLISRQSKKNKFLRAIFKFVLSITAISALAFSIYSEVWSLLFVTFIFFVAKGYRYVQHEWRGWTGTDQYDPRGVDENGNDIYGKIGGIQDGCAIFLIAIILGIVGLAVLSFIDIIALPLVGSMVLLKVACSFNVKSYTTAKFQGCYWCYKKVPKISHFYCPDCDFASNARNIDSLKRHWDRIHGERYGIFHSICDEHRIKTPNP